MGGWGEDKGPTPAERQQAEQLRAADRLSRVTTAYLKRPTTGMLDQLTQARDTYEASKW